MLLLIQPHLLAIFEHSGPLQLLEHTSLLPFLKLIPHRPGAPRQQGNAFHWQSVRNT